MNEESRRRIARLFLEESFGKYGNVLVNDINGQPVIVKKPFELWKEYGSIVKGKREGARAFEVIYAPYISGAKKRLIAVSKDPKELREIVNQNFDPERIRLGLVEFESYKGYKIAYD